MNSFEKLAEGLFQTMAEFGLETSVMFITEDGPLFYSHNHYELSPLEKDMFLAIHQEGRFCDFGCRTFCNFKRVSLLIKNMPEANPERYGRIKDTVPWILGSTDGKVGALDLHLVLVEQHSRVSATIDELTSEVQSLQHQDQRGQSLGTGLASVLGQLEELKRHQQRTQERMNATMDQSTTELADEIFSSDVDFF
ncbi:MAG: hypothetical protein EOO68_40630 [Moraxellaceae bacterium]|nr:MAG: hypothetical protein EOO68_40630 [Moraxellaceae bacterium]